MRGRWGVTDGQKEQYRRWIEFFRGVNPVPNSLADVMETCWTDREAAVEELRFLKDDYEDWRVSMRAEKCLEKMGEA